MSLNVVYAIADTTVVHNGAPHWIHPGERWSADDPLVKAHPNLFSADAVASPGLRVSQPLESFFDETPERGGPARVEQATAAPGEKRTTRRPRKRAAAKKTSTARKRATAKKSKS